jgi:hypothetical protein
MEVRGRAIAPEMLKWARLAQIATLIGHEKHWKIINSIFATVILIIK